MSLMKRLSKAASPEKNETTGLSLPFIAQYFEDQTRADHPYLLALHTYKQLLESTNSQEEVFLYMVEDIIFSSLYATFYEQLLFTARENPQLAVPLIATFERDQNEREQVISEQSQNHFNFILNGGHCDGCTSCDNHADVAEIMSYVHGGDYEFIKNLYIGMQAIQFAMEELIYDLTPANDSWLQDYTPENVLDFRQRIIADAEKRNAC